MTTLSVDGSNEKPTTNLIVVSQTAYGYKFPLDKLIPFAKSDDWKDWKSLEQTFKEGVAFSEKDHKPIFDSLANSIKDYIKNLNTSNEENIKYNVILEKTNILATNVMLYDERNKRTFTCQDIASFQFLDTVSDLDSFFKDIISDWSLNDSSVYTTYSKPSIFSIVSIDLRPIKKDGPAETKS